MGKKIKTYEAKNGKGTFVKEEGSKHRTFIPNNGGKHTKFDNNKKTG